jgi:hypothetical protein
MGACIWDSGKTTEYDYDVLDGAEPWVYPGSYRIKSKSITIHPVTTRSDGALQSIGNDSLPCTSSSSKEGKQSIKVHVSFIFRPLADQDMVEGAHKRYIIDQKEEWDGVDMPNTKLYYECPGGRKQLAHFIRSLLV